MRSLRVLVVALLVTAVSPGIRASTVPLATLPHASLDQRFLLQVSYEQAFVGFNTSRSRVVTFRRDGAVLQMLDASDAAPADNPRILATIPICDETRGALEVDLNEGFDRVYQEEDRTGEDYYGRIGRRDRNPFPLVARQAVSVSYHDETVVFDQSARTSDGHGVLIHYYLTPYRPARDFRPFEMKDLERFGFFETYPQWHNGAWVLYAMKFDAQAPIVFALSAAIPDRYRSAIRDGVLYWNRAFGRPVLQVIDAPAGVRAPNPDYNVIQWVTSGAFGSSSYIQSDPFTGQILHAHIFLLPETLRDGDLEQQNDQLRYLAAHEVGHALGLRHNFASGGAATVMDYFKWPAILQIGRDIRTGAPALPYDRAIVQHVYLGAPLDAQSLPPFCTDSQQGCFPFRSTPNAAAEQPSP